MDEVTIADARGENVLTTLKGGGGRGLMAFGGDGEGEDGGDADDENEHK